MNKKTIFSPCRKYRYTLWREWDCDLLTGCADDLENSGGYLMVIGLNPSTADETNDDPTIRRCIDFAKRWGYRALCMTNLFAFRATDPRDMMKLYNLADIDNQHHLLKCASGAGMVLAAWGKHGRFAQRDLTVCEWLSRIGIDLHCLQKNKDGSPRHPLYVAADTEPVLLRTETVASAGARGAATATKKSVDATAET